mmetsp:Transcript_93839/g.270365  ORF Transcript_93839/g.270365 Transcript_93839/m.270365 type:complete len:274 (+) Transcript_93839:81-902(+)
MPGFENGIDGDGEPRRLAPGGFDHEDIGPPEHRQVARDLRTHRECHLCHGLVSRRRTVGSGHQLRLFLRTAGSARDATDYSRRVTHAPEGHRAQGLEARELLTVQPAADRAECPQGGRLRHGQAVPSWSHAEDACGHPLLRRAAGLVQEVLRKVRPMELWGDHVHAALRETAFHREDLPGDLVQSPPGQILLGGRSVVECLRGREGLGAHADAHEPEGALLLPAGLAAHLASAPGTPRAGTSSRRLDRRQLAHLPRAGSVEEGGPPDHRGPIE